MMGFARWVSVSLARLSCLNPYDGLPWQHLISCVAMVTIPSTRLWYSDCNCSALCCLVLYHITEVRCSSNQPTLQQLGKARWDCCGNAPTWSVWYEDSSLQYKHYLCNINWQYIIGWITPHTTQYIWCLCHWETHPISVTLYCYKPTVYIMHCVL